MIHFKRYITSAALILFLNICAAQYCGTSGPNVCSNSNTLTVPGLMNYQSFPCVRDSVPFDEVIYFLVPEKYGYFDTPVLSMRIDSITNLPCGLCWQCDAPNRTYMPGSRGCIRISGIPSESKGVYQTKVYATITTVNAKYGTIFDSRFQFYLNVVGKNDSCPPITITKHLSIACKSVDSNEFCDLNIIVKASRPVVNCNFDTTNLYVSQPTGSHLGYYWDIIDKNWNETEDSTPVIKVDTSTLLVYLQLTDSVTGCVNNEFIPFADYTGPYQVPKICYTTFDSTYGTQRGLKIVFEKNDWFNTFAGYGYDVYLQYDPLQPSRLVDHISSTSQGVVTDTIPQAADIYFIIEPYISNYYSVVTYLNCLSPVQETGSDFFNAPVLWVDSAGLSSSGYPSLYWMNSRPINYDRLFIFSRRPGGNWRTRQSTNDFSTYFWIDYFPDSTVMEYMIGFRLIGDCDPSRSSGNMAFTDYGLALVSPEKVDTTTDVEVSTTSSKKDNNRFYINPNPASSKLHLQTEVSVTEGMTYTIHNALGERIQAGIISETFMAIDISQMNSGAYIITLLHNGMALGSRRFIKH